LREQRGVIPEARSAIRDPLITLYKMRSGFRLSASLRPGRQPCKELRDEVDVTTPAQPTEQDKARGQLMIGAAIVMGACVFGGLTAVVLMALDQRVGAGAVAILAGVAILVGVAIQVAGFRRLKASRQ
jgi:hypothetical protein